MKPSPYVETVMRSLWRLPLPLKRRVKRELEADIEQRRSRGESLAEIEASMGAPREAAASIEAGLCPKFNSRLSLLRYLYLLAAMVPTVRLLITVTRVLITPTPSGYASAAELFKDLLQNYFPMVAVLAVNYLLYLVLCSLGCLAFSRQLLLKKRCLTGMVWLAIAIGVLLFPIGSARGLMALEGIFAVLLWGERAFSPNLTAPQLWLSGVTILLLWGLLICQRDDA